MNLAPIVLFVYNRPDHTKRTIEALKKNTLATESELFIFADGPKNELAQPKVTEVRNYIRTITGFKNVIVHESEINNGLAHSIINNVTDVVNTHGSIIVLEDDIVTSPYFLQYMNDALTLYKDIPEVMHVSGYFFPNGKHLPKTFFYNQASCWGWATWARAWQHFSTDTDTLISVLKRAPANQKIGQKMYLRNALSQLYANKRGELKTWAAKWQACVTQQNGFCLHPHIPFSINIGHDGSGVHSGADNVYGDQYEMSYAGIETLPLVESAEAITHANVFLKKLRGPLIPRIIRRLKKLL